MPEQQTDQTVLHHIERLMSEEKQLRAQEAPTGADLERLKQIDISLDQCWDLLRQRRALREYGRDPGEAHVRPEDVVERYSG